MWSSGIKRISGTHLVSDISLKLDIPKFDTALVHSNWSNLRRKYLRQIPKDINVLSCGPKAWEISWISDAISPARHSQKNPRSMYARVPQAMAQFVLKIEKLSHIMGQTPILEMARAYGLRPRLWLLERRKTWIAKGKKERTDSWMSWRLRVLFGFLPFWVILSKICFLTSIMDLPSSIKHHREKKCRIYCICLYWCVRGYALSYMVCPCFFTCPGQWWFLDVGSSLNGPYPNMICSNKAWK